MYVPSICKALRVRNFGVKLVNLPPHLSNFVFALNDNLLDALCCVHRNNKNLVFKGFVQCSLYTFE